MERDDQRIKSPCDEEHTFLMQDKGIMLYQIGQKCQMNRAWLHEAERQTVAIAV